MPDLRHVMWIGIALGLMCGCGDDGAPARDAGGGGADSGGMGTGIGPEGGAVATPSGSAAVIIPAGAIGGRIEIGIREVTEMLAGAETLLTPAYEITPGTALFDLPVTLSIALPSAPARAPVIVVLNESTSTWEELPGSIYMDGRAYAQTTHFSFYGVALPPGPLDACREMQASAAPGTVHPLVTPGSVTVMGATKTGTQASGFSGASPLELGSTWTGSQRFVQVSGNAGIAGMGAWIDWSTMSADSFTVEADGTFSFWVDLHTQGPYLGLTDACLAPTADTRNGWLYNLNIHCDDACTADPATMPPTMTCGPTELCMRSIDMCGAMLTQTACEAWYADPASCRDMATYTTCNCACITQPTCTEYFDCGQVCFDASCP